jgi:penicillin G amidase
MPTDASPIQEPASRRRPYRDLLFVLLSILILGGLLFAQHRLLAPLRLGFIDPATGFWGYHLGRGPGPEGKAYLQAPAEIGWDSRGVPHVYAADERSLYFAQGYATASKRLWQMDFLSRMADGRLSEIVGKGGVSSDSFFRAIAIHDAAKRENDALSSFPTTKLAVEAYSAGVNAYLDEVTAARRGSFARLARGGPSRLPIEFQAFGYEPERWTPLKTLLILKLLSWDMTGQEASQELLRTNSLAKLGSQRFGQFFLPEGAGTYPEFARSDWPVSGTRGRATTASPFTPAAIDMVNGKFPPPNIGSNSWVEAFAPDSPFKNGLENDPHLRLGLPSFWFETQLADPGQQVRGVAIPGLPGIIIGFNPSLAWGITNGAVDTADFYEIHFRDSSWAEYWFDGGWRKTEQSKELIRVAGGGSEELTLYRTIWGPVAFGSRGNKEKIGYALRWTAARPADNLGAFLAANRARDRSEFASGIAKLVSPTLNFTYIDRTGNIGGWLAGAIPHRLVGEGRTVSDGTSDQNSWRDFLPFSANPQAFNPRSGFISSANQYPVDSNYPFYMSGAFAPDYRARRIAELIEASRTSRSRDVFSMFSAMGHDAKSLEAEQLLPRLLAWTESGNFSPREKQYLARLAKWDFIARHASIEPSLYDAWRDEFKKEALADLIGDDPKRARLLSVNELARLDSATRPQLVETAVRSFRRAVANLDDRFGKDSANWTWGKARGTRISHLLALPIFPSIPVQADGGLESVADYTRATGPSWRMVVAFDRQGQVHARGMVLGGQGGDLADPNFDSGVQPFLNGKLNELRLVSQASDPSFVERWTLRMGAKR